MSLSTLKGFVSIRATAEALEFDRLQFCWGVKSEFQTEIKPGTGVSPRDYDEAEGWSGYVYHKSIVKLVRTYPRVTSFAGGFAIERLMVTLEGKAVKVLEFLGSDGSYRLSQVKRITAGGLAKVRWNFPSLM